MRALPLVCGMTLCALAATAAELPRRPALGVEVVPSAQRGASVATIPAHVRWKGPALAVGDTITVIDGKPVASPADVTRMLNDRNLGDEVALEARRGEQSIRTGAAIVEQPRESSDRFAVDYLTLPLPEGRRRLVLLRPHGATPRPAVLMIGGLGCYPADNPFNPNEAQRALTHELSGAGYITLRVEKTGAGDSEGPPCADAPMQAEIDGLAAALRWLKRHPQVDASRVFIVGLSMGGIVGPRVAALEAVAGMAFFEIVGGTSWLEYELENRRRQLGLRDRPAAQIDQMVRDRAWCLNEVMVDRRAAMISARGRPASSSCVTRWAMRTCRMCLRRICRNCSSRSRACRCSSCTARPTSSPRACRASGWWKSSTRNMRDRRALCRLPRWTTGYRVRQAHKTASSERRCAGSLSIPSTRLPARCCSAGCHNAFGVDVLEDKPASSLQASSCVRLS
jgi:PDZ domain/X-Pro dipeptidyl-peptidase (S15 family)